MRHSSQIQLSGLLRVFAHRDNQIGRYKRLVIFIAKLNIPFDKQLQSCQHDARVSFLPVCRALRSRRDGGRSPDCSDDRSENRGAAPRGANSAASGAG